MRRVAVLRCPLDTFMGPRTLVLLLIEHLRIRTPRIPVLFRSVIVLVRLAVVLSLLRLTLALCIGAVFAPPKNWRWGLL